MREQIEVLVRGVCVKDGMVLLCRTENAPITYLPGGHVEFNETAREALEREIVEELGVASSAGRFLGAVEHSFIQKGKRQCEWNVFFELSVPDLNPDIAVEPLEEHLSFSWCAMGKLNDAGVEPAVLRDLLPEWIGQGGHRGRWASAGDFA